MKKALVWGSVVSCAALLVALGVMGVKIFRNNYEVMAECCIALACLVINVVCNLSRALCNKCPHCGRLRLSNGKYCSHCGKEN